MNPTPTVISQLAGLAVPYLRTRAETFADEAKRLGITGLNVTEKAGQVVVTVPEDAALAQYGGGVDMPSAWVEHAAISVGGGLE